jgi:hypothetical protein
MAFAILSDDTKSSLEQERSRLIEDRDRIIEAAVEQATAEIDQALHNLNQLLGDADTSVEDHATEIPDQPKTASNPTRKPATQRKSKQPAALSEEQSTLNAKAQPTSQATAPTATPARTLVLKPEFQSVTPTEAVKQIIQQVDKPMATEDVIPELYQSLEEADLSTARKSVALILGRGTHQGVYEKVEENPSRYQIKASGH